MDAIEKISKAITDGQKEATTGIVKVVGPIIRGVEFIIHTEIEALRTRLERVEVLLRETNRCIAAGFPTNTAERIEAYFIETKGETNGNTKNS